MKKDGLIFRKKATANSATAESVPSVTETHEVKDEKAKLRPKSLELNSKETDEKQNEKIEVVEEENSSTTDENK